MKSIKIYMEVPTHCEQKLKMIKNNVCLPVAGDLSGVTEEVSENTNKSNGTDRAEILP